MYIDDNNKSGSGQYRLYCTIKWCHEKTSTRQMAAESIWVVTEKQHIINSAELEYIRLETHEYFTSLLKIPFFLEYDAVY